MSIPSRLQRYSPDLDRPRKDEKQTAYAIAKNISLGLFCASDFPADFLGSGPEETAAGGR